MKISKMTDYGVLVLNHLAQSGGSQQSTDDIVTGIGVSLPTARKVLKVLADAGLVQARRGSRGGYRLARSPEQIPLLAIVEAFEGKVSLTECSTVESDCDITDSCSLAGNWGGINQVLTLVLSGISLHDIRYPHTLQRITASLALSTDQIHLVNLD
ncbi:SUF system Fe-S cluster assembly regulator [Candidatus Thalassolituus haligoni]|uniref:SUF system Fe-S cluster assembly regulator n=1 Tax=Candidatus Thalassolituus haligoni TaxID=3100113 RepID=UPI0035183276|tara:strand:+ start:26391 stop:26858 length:468 start_codon:yes stop_codon:yes gene_type:complete